MERAIVNDKLRIRAYAKLNLALLITGKRPDGYHLLDMVMQNISIFDELELERHGTLRLEDDSSVEASDNLVMKAATLLKSRAGYPGGALIRLKKRIPSQAGMGGASADAAAALVGLNRLWSLGIDEKVLADMALSLGADVPFFLRGGTARARGIGERLTSLEGVPPMEYVIFKPWEGLSTQKVYENFVFDGRLQELTAYLAALEAGDWPGAARCMRNDLQAPAMALCPSVGRAADALAATGCLKAQMTGSGTAVFGWYPDAAAADAAYAALKGQMEGGDLYRATSRRRALEFLEAPAE
jgi:4-diphosphocytidyl-2-C-methyl-D-erythritol kinase